MLNSSSVDKVKVGGGEQRGKNEQKKANKKEERVCVPSWALYPHTRGQFIFLFFPATNWLIRFFGKRLAIWNPPDLVLSLFANMQQQTSYDFRKTKRNYVHMREG